MPSSITLRSTCYNHARFVVESLESVARQDRGDFEWIIVDDASTDGSQDVITHWLNEHASELEQRGIKITFIAHPQNLGFAATLNEIVQRASGEFLCGISCDDRLLPNRIATVDRMMNSLPAGYAGFYGDAYLIDASGQRTGERFIERHAIQPHLPETPLFDALLAGNFIPAPTVALYRRVLLELGGYDASLPYEDYDLWLRLTRRYQLAFCDDPTLEYRIHGDNFHLKFHDWRRANYWIYRKHLDAKNGAARFLSNLKGLLKNDEFDDAILNDLRTLPLDGLQGWDKMRASISKYEAVMRRRGEIG